ncbi:MAG: SusC/RagA family TonB-linked outer membrane protein [Bacteroidaceae bacterium]|nr:SusC/RagA family TonB-linked outer membrane protein [Bacteroidaceae bacterium]
MKNMQAYNSSNVLRICKYGFAAMGFLMGALPVAAQDEVDTPEATEAAEVVAAPRKPAKPMKKYPTIEVKGKVVDAATGEPLAGTQLQSYNNKNYTAMTDENGEFTINVPKFVTSLWVKLEGYNQVQVALNGKTEGVNVALYADTYLPDYTAKTTGTRSVSTSDFEESTAVTVDQEIQNRLGGDVRGMQRSAIPGQGVSMFINGLNSLNSNAMPLIILDGIVYDQMYSDGGMVHTGYFNNLLQAINMEDVESVEVLKNGTAIYGAKAANGVINIKTKRCHSMATRIDVNISGGVEFIPKGLDMMNASEYRAYAAEMLGSTDTKLTEFKFLNTDPNYLYYNMYHNNTDWRDEVYREAWTQNYGIAIQGGDDVAQYNLSVGYLDTESTLKMNDMQRFNIRFNTDIVLNKWFSTQFDASYTNVTRNLRSDGLKSDFHLQSLDSPGFLSYAKAPFLSPYDFTKEAGGLSHVTSFIADADDYLDEAVGKKASIANPKGILENGEAKNKNHSDCTMINLAIAPTWKPTANFSLTERFSYTMQSFDEDYFTPLEGMPEYLKDGNIAVTRNSKHSLFTKHDALFSDTRADWVVLPNGAHRLELFGGARFMSDTFNSSHISGDNTGTDKTPNMKNDLANRRIQGSDTNWKSLAYYANVDYNYMEKYYLTGQLSMETSSRFGKDVDAGLKMFGVAWGLFPSIQGAWVISNEKWFPTTSGVNRLKLNVGFESVGNDAMDNSATLTYLSAAALLQDGITSIGLSQIGNSSLRWETTNRCNIGLEGNFLNNRLSLRANFYHSKTNNLITLGTLAYVAGLTDYYTNDGSMTNTGGDIAFNAKIVNQKNFKFDLGASVGHYKSEIKSLPQGQRYFDTELYGGTIRSAVGESAGVFYGYKTKGVYRDSEQAKADGKFIVDENDNKQYFKAGDMIFVDKDSNGKIDDDDRFIIGDPNPDIFGNIYLNFHFAQNWALSANFNYSLGNDIYNYQRSLLESGSMFINQTKALDRRWMAENQVTDIPKITYGDPMGNARFSDRWIEDGSYLKLKNITLSYKLPIQNEYIQGLTVWAAANNLLTFTKYLGSDPEVSCGNGVLMQGIDAGYLTSGRSFHLGVKINL